MKQSMINYKKKEIKDIYFTPVEAIIPLVKYIPKNIKRIWECTDSGKSKISKIFREAGKEIISTDIITGFDFLNDEPDFSFDCIITNPPYSLKNNFLEKCYSYKKPFALLLPIETLGSISRVKMFQEYGISVIVLDRRVQYEDSSGCWFNSSWFIWGFNEGNELYFERIKKC